MFIHLICLPPLYYIILFTCFVFVLGINLDMDLMKERFAKLLLGEDMSGGGKGVSSALALSNAITNTAGIICNFTKILW